MKDAKHLKAILGKYEEAFKLNRAIRVAIFKGIVKSKLKPSPPASLIADLELIPTIIFNGKEYSLFKYADGWYLYRGPELEASKYNWLACYSKESDGKQYASKPYRKFHTTLSRIDGAWEKTLSGDLEWTNGFNNEPDIDWALYKKPIYEIVDKNFFKRKQPKRR